MSQEYNVLKTMQVREGDTPVYAHIIDDEKLGEATCSSNHVVDQFCQSFTKSGTTVTCEPLRGYPLEVEWQTKNLCTIDSIDTAVTVKETNLFKGNLNPPLVISADVSQITAPNQAGLVNAIWSDGTSTPLSVTMLDSGYVSTNKVLTALQYVNWCNATGTAKIQVEVGTQKTAYESYAETATITRCGKNLARYPYTDTTKTVNGITFTDNGDGTITANGTATASANFNLGTQRTWALKPGADYTASINQVSGTATGTPGFAVNYYRPGASAGNYSAWLNSTVNKTVTKPCPADYESVRSYVTIPSGAVCTNLVLSVQLEAGATATNHEPSTEPEIFAPGEPITAIPGVNTIFADAGLVTVTGKANPSAIIEKLTNAVLALGGNVQGGIDMFSLKSFIKKGLLDAIGKMADYQVILNSVGWMEKGVLTEEDLAEINAKIEAQYPVEQETEQLPIE